MSCTSIPPETFFKTQLLISRRDFHQAEIFLGGEFGFGGLVEAGRGDDFEEELVHFFRSFSVDRAIDANNATEG